jgi:hypothetical protein
VTWDGTVCNDCLLHKVYGGPAYIVTFENALFGGITLLLFQRIDWNVHSLEWRKNSEDMAGQMKFQLKGIITSIFPVACNMWLRGGKEKNSLVFAKRSARMSKRSRVSSQSSMTLRQK